MELFTGPLDCLLQTCQPLQTGEPTRENERGGRCRKSTAPICPQQSSELETSPNAAKPRAENYATSTTIKVANIFTIQCRLKASHTETVSVCTHAYGYEHDFGPSLEARACQVAKDLLFLLRPVRRPIPREHARGRGDVGERDNTTDGMSEWSDSR